MLPAWCLMITARFQMFVHRWISGPPLYGAGSIRFVRNVKGSQCWDNAPTERFFGTLKSEWVPRGGYSLIEEAKTDIVRFFMYYNRTRLHSYNDYLSPIAMEQKAA
ncbi:hypothetical protein BMS17_24595 [Pseudomonas sp. C9]|nr:hypothetical protein BMS17_24595 [Pseudomonas sp. C9]